MGSAQGGVHQHSDEKFHTVNTVAVTIERLDERLRKLQLTQLL